MTAMADHLEDLHPVKGPGLRTMTVSPHVLSLLLNVVAGPLLHLHLVEWMTDQVMAGMMIIT